MIPDFLTDRMAVAVAAIPLLLGPHRSAAEEVTAPDITFGDLIASTTYIPGTLIIEGDGEPWTERVEPGLASAFRDDERAYRGLVGVTFFVNKPAEVTFCCYPSPDAHVRDEIYDWIRRESLPRMEHAEFALAVQFAINGGDTLQIPEDFPCAFELPFERRLRQFTEMSFADRHEFLASWAKREVLPAIGHAMAGVDDRFEGVLAFAEILRNTDPVDDIDVEALTDSSSTYWRARLEMALEDPSIVGARVFLHLSRGEIDLAKRVLVVVNPSACKPCLASEYLVELQTLLAVYSDGLSTMISLGIDEFDRGELQAAIDRFSKITDIAPRCARAWHEYYLAYGTKHGDINALHDEYVARVYGSDPLFPIGMVVSTGEEAFRLGRRIRSQELFADPDSFAAHVLEYGDIALDLGAMGQAAELYWEALPFQSEETGWRAIDGLLYCLEQLGVRDLHENFRGDHEERLRRVEASRRSRMESSIMYQAMEKKR